MTAMGGEWYLYSPQPYDHGVLEGANIKHRTLGLPAKPSGLGYLGQMYYSRWAVKDGVDTFWSPRHHLPMSLPREIYGAVSIHDLVWMRYGNTMPRLSRFAESRLMPAAVERADKVFALSEFTANELSSNFPQLEQRVSTVFPASHLPPIASIEAKPSAQGRSYFLFVGTMEPRKNLKTLLLAYSRYVEVCPQPNALKLVGGKGWGDVSPEQLLSQFSLEDHVQVCGKVSELELSELYAHAHSLVMPSFYEGFGLPVIEALSQGVPVVVSRESAMSEAAGQAGISVDPESWQSLFEALMQISTDEALYRQLEALTLEQCLRYDWGKSAAQLYGHLTSRR